MDQPSPPRAADHRGCDQIQGFWLSRPIPAGEAGEFMAQRVRRRVAAPVAV